LTPLVAPINKKGQATVEYILLLVVVAVIFAKVAGQAQDIFYGWGGQQGAIELFIDEQIVKKLIINDDSGWRNP